MEYLKTKVKLLNLTNGITWLHINDPKLSEMSTGGFRMEVGRYDESRYIMDSGIAHLIEHLIVHHNTPEERSLFVDWKSITDSQNTDYAFTTAKKNFDKGFQIYWNNLVNFEIDSDLTDGIEAINSE